LESRLGLPPSISGLQADGSCLYLARHLKWCGVSKLHRVGVLLNRFGGSPRSTTGLPPRNGSGSRSCTGKAELMRLCGGCLFPHLKMEPPIQPGSSQRASPGNRDRVRR
jgi:hypothetical protein